MASQTPNVVIPDHIPPDIREAILRTDNLPDGCVPHPTNPTLALSSAGRPVFRKGNRSGAGENPLNRQATKLRMALVASVTQTDILEIMDTLIEAAKKGNITAAREVLDRTVGKADESVVVRRLQELEDLVAQGKLRVLTDREKEVVDKMAAESEQKAAARAAKSGGSGSPVAAPDPAAEAVRDVQIFADVAKDTVEAGSRGIEL